MKSLRAAVPALVAFALICPTGAMAQVTLRNLTGGAIATTRFVVMR